MVCPIPRPSTKTLTGKTRHRVGWRNKLVLQVEESWYYYTWQSDVGGSEKTEIFYQWRDATFEDISEGMLV